MTIDSKKEVGRTRDPLQHLPGKHLYGSNTGLPTTDETIS
ncbi:MAG: hypothetical protein ACI89U_003210 [Gammaproteobacteria bacterium]